MKNIKIALLVVAGMAIHFSSQAQEQTPQERANLTITKITRGIKASPNRKDSLRKVFEPYYIKLDQAKGNAAQIKKLDEERDAGVKVVLWKEPEYRAYERYLEDEKNHDKQPKAIESLYHGGQMK